MNHDWEKVQREIEKQRQAAQHDASGGFHPPVQHVPPPTPVPSAHIPVQMGNAETALRDYARHSAFADPGQLNDGRAR